MNPIAQTFVVNGPKNGVDGVLLTGVDIFFQSVDPVYGVTLQIRKTVNGVPSVNILPQAQKTLNANQVSSSTNAAVATNFTFDTPVMIQTNVQYALVVIPAGGNPNYNIWTAQLGGSDVTTGNPIYNNNQLGTLFTSSNDLNFTAVPLESIKYNLYTATFTATSGVGVFRNSNTDYFKVNTIIGSFIPGEQIYLANSIPAIGVANLQSGYTNTFSVGEYVYQGTSFTNSTANAIVYGGNNSLVKYRSLGGAFTTGLIKSANTALTSNVVAVSQNTATYTNNSIYVPDVSYTDFTVNNYIFVSTNSKTNTQIVQITSANTTTNVLTVSANIAFTDPNATIGRVRGDAALFGYLSSYSRTSPYGTLSLDSVTSNTTLNFANSSNSYLIGAASGAMANVTTIFNPRYESITSQFTQIVPSQTSATWGFRGTSNTYGIDSSYTTISSDVPYEFIDQQRMIISRSLELANLASNSSVQVQVSMNSGNNITTPYIDTIRTNVTTTHNIVSPSTWLSGYNIYISGANNVFTFGDTVWQSNSIANTSATVIGANSTVLNVINITSSNNNNLGGFIANSTSIITDAITGAVANVSAVQYKNELTSTGFISARYISKVVILAAGQDAEDNITYVGAYRPPGTNLLVYIKGLHAQDSDTFNSKDWSLMPETSSPALQSSLVNTADLVELTYGLPSSNVVYSNSIVSNTTSNIVLFPSSNTTAPFFPGQFIYLADQSYTIGNAAVVVAGSGYNNGDIVQLTGTAGYLNSNATFVVSTNSTGNVVSMTVSTGGVYLTNTALVANTTANNTGTGTGLTISTSAFNQSTRFNVRQVTGIANTTAIILNSNTSITSGNVAIGIIPNLSSQSGMFKYSNNNGIARYVNSSDVVFDSYLTFAIKVVLVANNNYIVPRIDDLRSLALQV